MDYRHVTTLHNDTCNPLLCYPQSQLDAMKLNRLHAATMAPAPSHIKAREEKGEVRPHQKARRASSDDNSRAKSTIPENRISTIPELTESFEKRLYLRDKRTMSLVSNYAINLIKIQAFFEISFLAPRLIDYPARFTGLIRFGALSFTNRAL